MPPRKSLPTLSSTPKTSGATRSQAESSKRTRTILSVSTSSSPIKKRSRRNQSPPDEVQLGESSTLNSALPEDQDDKVEKEVDPEVELEAWQDFAADHYEMVEQLPLELHRNFRLLRELDDGSLLQTDKLHKLVREYVAQRMEAEKLGQPTTNGSIVNSEQEEKLEDANGNSDSNGREENVQIVNGGTDAPKKIQIVSANDESIQDVNHEGYENIEVEEKEEQHEPRPEDLGVPIPDGAGALVLPPLDPMIEVPGRLQFPSTDQSAEGVPHPHSQLEIETDLPTAMPKTNGDLSSAEAKENTNDESKGNTRPQLQTRMNNLNGSTAHKLLPEIAKLSKELVRTGEEKVAVAVGAYNAIDRHIRALDSALTAQEASILLGLRPSTLPSSNVDGALNLAGDDGALPPPPFPSASGQVEEDDGAIGIGGDGGGEGRGRKKKGKKGKKRNSVQMNDMGQGGTGSGSGHVLELGEGEDSTTAAVAASYSIPPDPNEPRYCYCHQVSYGEMIGCENDECPLEWFHLACAGLQVSPTGKWWCNICRPKIALGKSTTATAATTITPAGKSSKSAATGSGRRRK